MEKFKSDFRESFHNSRKKMKPRGAKFWLNIVTLTLIIVVIFAARKNIEEAFLEIGKANLLILLLIIPTQFLSFYAETEIFFTYLRERGQLKKTSALEATSMSLEMNFVNHIFPSGGVSGVGYMNWRLGKLGVSSGQATLSQLIKYVIEFGTFFVLLIFALLWTTAGDQVPNWIVAGSVFGITALVFIVAFGGFLISSEARMRSFAAWLTRNVNNFASAILRRRVEPMKLAKTEKFFLDFHHDYNAIRADKKLLVKPIIWSFIVNFAEIGMFIVTFWALGYWVNPAILLIAYGAGQISGIFMITPGGAGAYEAIMIGILTASSVNPGVAFAGVILTRVILILLTLVSGFFTYQKALKKYGKYSQNAEKIRENEEENDDEDFRENFGNNGEENSELRENRKQIFREKTPENYAPKFVKLDEIGDENNDENSAEIPEKFREKNDEKKSNFREKFMTENDKKREKNFAKNAEKIPRNFDEEIEKSGAKIDEKFAKKSAKNARKKLKLSRTEEQKFAKMNIADIEIDGDNFHEDV